jgi:hypothetical protein
VYSVFAKEDEQELFQYGTLLAAQLKKNVLSKPKLVSLAQVGALVSGGFSAARSFSFHEFIIF